MNDPVDLVAALRFERHLRQKVLTDGAGAKSQRLQPTAGAGEVSRSYGTDLLPEPGTMVGIVVTRMKETLEKVGVALGKARDLGKRVLQGVLPSGSKPGDIGFPFSSGSSALVGGAHSASSIGGDGSLLAILVLLLVAHLRRGRSWFRLELLNPRLVPQLIPERPD